MPTSYMTCGLAFSGKSWGARKIAVELGTDLVSLDAINLERGLDGGGSVAAASGSRVVILYMDTPVEVIEARRAENRRNPIRPHIRDDVFTAHREGFQHPQPDESIVRIADDATLQAWLAAERDAT